MFNGKLTPFVSSAITILIATAVIAGSLFSLLSTCRPVVAMPDDDTAPILALMVTMIVAAFPMIRRQKSCLSRRSAPGLYRGVDRPGVGPAGYFQAGFTGALPAVFRHGGYFAGAGLLLIQGALRVVTDLP